MTVVQIYDTDANERERIETRDAIAAQLAARGIRYEHLAARELGADTAPDAVLSVYADEIGAWMSEGGYVTADVVALRPGDPVDPQALRDKFCVEHTHSEDEVRFFAEGGGLFALHLGDEVLLVQCSAGDLISVPAGTTHWFDAGEKPHFVAVRLFCDPAGWVAEYTGDAIAARFPLLDDLVAG